MSDLPEWLPYVIAVVLCISILGLVFWRLSPLLFFKSRAINVEGRITNWMSMKEKGIVYYYPMIEFTDLNGQNQSYRADERCEGRPIYPIGSKVIVHYNQKNPTNAKTTYPK